MSNIGYPGESTLGERVKMMLLGAAKLNLIKVMAFAQGNVESVLRLSDAVLNRSEIDSEVKMVALIRFCVVAGSDYERTLLESVSKGEGMSDEIIKQARLGSACADLPEMHRMAAMLGEELAFRTKPTSTTHAYFLENLPKRQYVELVQAIAFYLMQTRVIETFEVELEDPPVNLAVRMDEVDKAKLEAWREGRL